LIQVLMDKYNISCISALRLNSPCFFLI